VAAFVTACFAASTDGRGFGAFHAWYAGGREPSAPDDLTATGAAHKEGGG